MLAPTQARRSQAPSLGYDSCYARCFAKARGKREGRRRQISGAQGGREKDGKEADFVKLTDKQVQAAHIEVGAVRTGFAGAVEAPAAVIADPQHAAVVSSSVSGRVVAIRKNLGESVAKGDVLAVIESREVAQFSADVALARRQLALAEAGFKREDRLYAEKSPRQEYELAQSALDDARTGCASRSSNCPPAAVPNRVPS
jgi:cobalt-zinc-cadmium efflux system membrane fusion protein